MFITIIIIQQTINKTQSWFITPTKSKQTNHCQNMKPNPIRLFTKPKVTVTQLSLSHPCLTADNLQYEFDDYQSCLSASRETEHVSRRWRARIRNLCGTASHDGGPTPGREDACVKKTAWRAEAGSVARNVAAPTWLIDKRKTKPKSRTRARARQAAPRPNRFSKDFRTRWRTTGAPVHAFTLPPRDWPAPNRQSSRLCTYTNTKTTFITKRAADDC